MVNGVVEGGVRENTKYGLVQARATRRSRNSAGKFSVNASRFFLHLNSQHENCTRYPHITIQVLFDCLPIDRNQISRQFSTVSFARMDKVTLSYVISSSDAFALITTSSPPMSA